MKICGTPGTARMSSAAVAHGNTCRSTLPGRHAAPLPCYLVAPACLVRQQRGSGQLPRDLSVRGFGEEVFGGYLDLAKLVSGSGSAKKSVYERLAYKIGQDVYADFGGWHLYLRDMKGTADLKMAQVLADAIGTKISSKGYDERDVEDLLKGIAVPLGSGKVQVSLMQTIPSFCVQDLMRICKDYARDI